MLIIIYSSTQLVQSVISVPEPGRGLHTLDFVLLLLFAEIMSSLSHETRKPANIHKEEVNLVNILQLRSK